MIDLAIAKGIHVLSIVVWIGGVAFVTSVLIPAIRNSTDETIQISIFNHIESRFSKIARFAVVVAGLSGFYMTYRLNAWYRFFEIQYAWMHSMVFIWLMFMFALFVIEPFISKYHGRIIKNNQISDHLLKTHIVHWMILILSMTTIFFALLGSHGF